MVKCWFKLSTEDDVRVRIWYQRLRNMSQSLLHRFSKVWMFGFLSRRASCWQRLMSGHVGQRPVRESRCRWFSGWCYTSCQFSHHPPFCLRVPLFEDCLLYHCIWQSLSTCWQITLCTGSSNWEVDMRCDMSTNTKALSNCDTHKALSDKIDSKPWWRNGRKQD